MNEELYQEWIKALDSGEYSAGRQALYTIDTDSYCCFGVLCDISEIGQWVRDEKDVNPNNLGYKFPEDIVQFGVAPIAVCNAVGMKNPSGSFNLNDVSSYLQDIIAKYTLNEDMPNHSLLKINDTFKENHEITQFGLISAILKERPKSLFYPYKFF